MDRERVGWSLAAVMALLCFLSRGAAALEPWQTPPWNVRLVGQIGGYCTTLQAMGDYCYIGEVGTLTILDVRNPAQRSPVGRFSVGGDAGIAHLQVKEGLAYLAISGAYASAFGGLRIVDVSNPRLPRLRGSYATPAQACGLYVTGGLAYVTWGISGYGQRPHGVHIVDVTNPSSPTLLGSFNTPSFPRKVYVVGGVAYVAADYYLLIYDVRNPSSVRHLASYPMYYCYDVYVSGGLAYVTGYGTEIVDVTSPSAPTLRGRVGFLVGGNGLFLSGKLLYLASYDNLEIFDVANSSSPTLVASFPTTGTAYAVAVSSGTAYVACRGGGLTIVDVRNPSRPALRATYDTLSDPREVQVIGNVAYVANGVRGFKTIDVSNPQRPTVLGSRRTPGIPEAISVSGKFAYLSGSSFQIMDITTPSLPWLRGSYGVAAEDVAASGGMAYLASNGLEILDVSNPSSPTLRGKYYNPGPTPGVFVSGGFAYLADYTLFRIFDVRNPAAPFQRSSLYLYHSVGHVQVSNGFAYVLGHGDNYVGYISCVDVRNPDAPRRVGQYQAPFADEDWGGLYVTDGYAYAVMDGLYILDVRDPAHPTLRGWYPSGYTGRPFVSGDLIYLASGWGLRIFQFTGRVSDAPRWQLYR